VTCFDCGELADHEHHVVPRSLGGTKTVPLCTRCHGLVHGRDFLGHVRLTRAGLQRAKRDGRQTGLAGYGYRANGGKLEIDGFETVVVCAAQELRAAGMSQRAIVAALAARGLVSRAGRPFAQTQVCRMLKVELVLTHPTEVRPKRPKRPAK